MAATGPLLLFSTSPLRREAFRVLLLYHADIPVVGVGELLDAVRTLETASCTAVLVDCTVPEPELLTLAGELAFHARGRPLGAILPASAAIYVPMLQRLGVRALLSSEASLEEFLFGLSAPLAGQDFVSPPFAEHLRRSMEREHAPHRQLSAREWQVFALLVQGWGNTAIARRLNVAPKTVGEYRRRIARKLGCTTVAELVHYAVAHGLVKPFGSLPQALSEEA
jgi:DNA-binding NarL/FixJ family response regulator